MAGYISLFDLGESQDDVEVEYNSLHHYRADSGASTPETVKPREVLDEYVDPEDASSPFRPSWLYGYNSKIPVHNLYTLRDHLIAFAGSHQVVIMDIKKREQHILQGHRNNVTCLAKSNNGTYLASGDVGPDQHSVFVWSVISKKPVLKMTNPHGSHGVEALQFTAADRWLVTVGGSSSHQSVCLWDWKNSPESPISCVPMKAGKVYSFVGAHPINPDQFLVSSKTTVTFFSFDQSSAELCSHNPGSIEKEFGKSCGHLTQSVYLRNTRQVLSATTRGNLVVWLTNGGAETPLPKWKPTRLLRLEEEGISALMERDGFVAVADATGSITFFNEEMQKVKWVQNFDVGRILSISYRVEDESFERKGNEIILSDFIISVEGSLCGYVNFSTGNLQTLVYGKGAPWTFHDIHPSKNTLVLGNIYGFVSTYNYLSNEHVSDKDLNIEDEITCVKYSTHGDLLAVGTKKGHLWLLNEETLDPVRSVPFSYSKGAIRSCQFSDCGEFLATSDTDRCVSVYKQNKLLGTPWQWELLGRYRGHSRPVLQMLFGKDPETNGRLLFTLGKDMKLNEYDLESSSISDGLILVHRTEVEQRCQPTCMAWYPPGATEENFLVLANKHHKQRLINMGTKMCRKVVLGPQHGAKYISQMKFIPGLQGLSPLKNTDGYFAIICGTHISLQKIPLSGSPFSYMSKLANPKGVDEMFLSPTGKYCFTMNKEDESFQQWDIDPLVLEDFSMEGGSGSEAFFSLIPDKKESKLFKDMKDYFCYVQIEKGATTLSNKIPLEDVPTVCRALGFYPTEREIEDMMNEIKYSNYVNTGQLETEIVLEDFFQLFLNHKPARGEDISELEKVFKIIGKDSNDDQNTVPNINRSNLIDFLKTRGDGFKEKDFNQYVKPLFTSNYSNTSGEVDAEEDHNEFFHIPEELSYKDFVRGALKISETFSFKSELTRGVSLTNDSNVQIVLDDHDLPIKA